MKVFIFLIVSILFTGGLSAEEFKISKPGLPVIVTLSANGASINAVGGPAELAKTPAQIVAEIKATLEQLGYKVDSCIYDGAFFRMVYSKDKLTYVAKSWQDAKHCFTVTGSWTVMADMNLVCAAVEAATVKDEMD